MRRLALLIALVTLAAGCTAPAADTGAATTETPERVATTPAAPPTVPPTPAVPTLSSPPEAASPADGARGVPPGETTLRWTAARANVPGTITYRVLVDGEAVCTTTTLTCTLRTVEASTYRWRVAALLEGAQDLLGRAASFRTNVPPEVPTIASPAAGSHSTAQTLTVRLAGLTDADGDRVEATAELTDVTTGAVTTARCVGTRCTLNGLALATPHLLVVRATDGKATVETAPLAFRTDAPPSLPVLVQPAAGSHGTLRDAAFQFTGGTDPDGDPVTATVELQDGGSIRAVACGTCATTLELGRAYAWRVKLTDGILTTTSDWVPFRTDAPPLPVRIDPGDDGMVQLPLVADWTEPPTTDPDGDALTYAYRVRDDAGRVVHQCEGLAAPECTLQFPRHGQTYEVVVEARDPYGLASTSSFHVTTRLPIVLIRGYAFFGDAVGDETWGTLVPILEEAGFDVLDFYPASSKTTLDLDDRDPGGIASIAFDAGEAIEDALVANGYAADQPVDVIAHSMGGLVSRYLVEMGGVDYESGPYVVTVSTQWDGQFRTLTTLGTPHRGSGFAEWCPYAVCEDMSPGSRFLQTLGTSPRPAWTTYVTAIGSEDAIVSQSSGRLDSVDLHYVIDGACHGDDPCSITYHDGTLDLLGAVLAPVPGA